MNIRGQVKYLIILLSSVLVIPGMGNANPAEDPIKMLEGVTHQVMNELQTHRKELRKNPDRIYALVNHIILPHVDFAEVGRWVVGRNAWQRASNEAQQAFINEFKVYVVRGYARSLLAYNEHEVKFLPLRGSANQERLQVGTLIIEPGSSPIHMNYRLIREGNSWKVYDIIVEGISLMQGYHAQFAEDVRRGGVDAVVARLRSHNGG